MPTLEAGSRYGNIIKSINAFVDAQIRVGLGQTVYFEDEGRLGNLPQRWIEIDFIEGEQVGEILGYVDGGHTTFTECYLNINVFEQVESGTTQTNVYTVYTLIDNIREMFEVPCGITVYDYGTVGNPVAGRLTTWVSPMVRRIATPPDAGIKQFNISVPLRYHSVVAA